MNRMRTAGWLALTILMASVAIAGTVASQPTAFSAAQPGGRLPEAWTVKTLPKVLRSTQFSLVSDDGATALRAESEAAAASVTHALRVDLARTPLLSWRWKVSRALETADLRTKAGDDYAGRVYVLFDDDAANQSVTERLKLKIARAIYGDDVPATAICYVWGNRYPAGTTAWNAYTDRLRIVVVESGSAHAGRWLTETRDVAADFRAAFGRSAPPVIGIALAADTDNTGETVVTHFGDVTFLAKPAMTDTRSD
jgi:DUF3047 family protein